MGDIIGGWRLECGCVHNLLTMEAGSHESRLCPLHEAAPNVLAALETMTAWVEKWQRDGKLAAGALLAMANHVDEARAAIAKAKP
jgi:hypothetical protein